MLAIGKRGIGSERPLTLFIDHGVAYDFAVVAYHDLVTRTLSTTAQRRLVVVGKTAIIDHTFMRPLVINDGINPVVIRHRLGHHFPATTVMVDDRPTHQRPKASQRSRQQPTRDDKAFSEADQSGESKCQG